MKDKTSSKGFIIGEATGAQKGDVTCPKSQNRFILPDQQHAELGIGLGLSDTQLIVLATGPKCLSITYKCNKN